MGRPPRPGAPTGKPYVLFRVLLQPERSSPTGNHGTPSAAEPQPHDCTSEQRAPKFRRFLQLPSPSGVRKSAHASKISNVSRTEGHGKAGLIRILFSVCVGEFGGWSLIPPGPSIGCCWAESAVRICAYLGCRSNTSSIQQVPQLHQSYLRGTSGIYTGFHPISLRPDQINPPGLLRRHPGRRFLLRRSTGPDDGSADDNLPGPPRSLVGTTGGV